ncbi:MULTISPECIES: MetQ/NlpA family ABC transporter substrate-binding protein [Bifidobacterium]|uniref:MetQ/NlpA family ABC transporter substrate-binding protein n=1 Tax=Bifidobacterium TaxID=1678 RepID=UPI001BDCF562|nr:MULTISPECIES: MetQ/NlpA family ABC transporter substrate-binding protein [Bifidobacterium]MBT1161127.1 hypothetical protein [Bifidobacterium sp. SO1]MBW3078201.1 hypothetical protein [Bifidobacterium simiiventris]
MRSTITRAVKAVFGIALSAGLVLSAAACGTASANDADTAKTIRLAASPGPYSELFKKGVAPILEKQGYTIKVTTFSDAQQANDSLNEGSTDLNVDQHTAYMDAYNEKKNGTLESLIPIPSVPAGLYSKKHTSVDQITNGATIAVSQDPSNLARALRLLEKLGWITLKDDSDSALGSINDVATNPKNLNLETLDNGQIPRVLDDVDYAVVTGSWSYSAKLDPKLELAQETLKPEYEIVAVTRKDEANKQWAKDVVAAYKSKTFHDYLAKNNTTGYWFVPDELKQ